MKSIAVLGSGSWGCALALTLERAGQHVRLWGYDPSEIESIKSNGSHERYLPGIPIPKTIELFTDLKQACQDIQTLLICVPSKGFSDLIDRLAEFVTPNTQIVWATKGLEPNSNGFFHTLIQTRLPNIKASAVLSGPSFAKEVAQKQPTAVLVASNNVEFAKYLQQAFDSPTFKVSISTDMIGTQLGNVYKNVLAVACGIAEGVGLGANAQAAIITYGLQELQTLAHALGAKPETVLSLACLGDAILTCTDNQSRNRRFGLALGAGQTVEEAKQAVGQTVEAVYNIEQLVNMANQHNLSLPILTKTHDILAGSLSPDQIFS